MDRGRAREKKTKGIERREHGGGGGVWEREKSNIRNANPKKTKTHVEDEIY